MGKSVDRVAAAARDASLDIEIITLETSARTAAHAAESCACEVGQIVKSLVFEGADSGKLVLVLVSGAHDLDVEGAKTLFGEPLCRADPRRVRAKTGFAIGGVAPIGHLCDIEAFMDDALLAYDVVWAAGGAPETVFVICPRALCQATSAKLFHNGRP